MLRTIHIVLIIFGLPILIILIDYTRWGRNDNTCPPTTSYAVWNTLKCPKESLITPINEHWTSDATEYGQYEWIMKHLK